MNYEEFLSFKNETLSKNKNLINLAENNLYKYLPTNIEYDQTGHINNIVYRCHLVEDWLKYYNLPQDFKKSIGVSNGVRHSIETISKQLKDKKFLIPADVYPFYQKTLKELNINYSEYQTLKINELYKDIANEEADILLITDPLKPLGRDVENNEYDLIENWLKKDIKRLLLIDAVYMLDTQLNKRLFQLYESTNQVIFMFSLSKSWCLPNHFGITLMPNNELGKNIREEFKKLEKDQNKLNIAFMAINKNQTVPINIKEIFNKNRLIVEKIIKEKLPNSNNNPSYLFYTEKSFEYFLEKGILVIPATVFNGGKGSIISILI